MLFDSNRNGAVNNLVTEVPAGSTVIWRRDRCSGIQKILRVYPKKDKGSIFVTEARKRLFLNVYVLRIPKSAKGEESYNIDYRLRDKTEVTIDPTLKVPPPPAYGSG